MSLISWSGPHPFCIPHQSHFCPCVRPEIYDVNDPKDREYLRGWAAIAPIVPFTNDEPPPEED